MLLLLLACNGNRIAEDTHPRDTDTEAPVDTDVAPAITGFAVTVDPDVATILHATWTGPDAETWVEYRFEGDAWLVAPSIAPGQAAVLGVPSLTGVEVRAVATVDGERVESDVVTAITGRVPSSMPLPTVSSYQPDLAYDADYAMIVVASGDYTYQGPYWIELFDRQGRIVWYKRVPNEALSFYPSVSRDGTHIWWERTDLFGMTGAEPVVTRQTLDGRWSEPLPLPGMGQAIAEGPDGDFFYELRTEQDHALMRLHPDGSTNIAWDCAAFFRDLGIAIENCDMNAVNWDEARNTVLVSQFYTSTVFEVDLDVGAPIRQMGQLTAGEPWTFDPPVSMFDYQHWPYWTEEGTLLVSTHVPAQPGVQVAAEYVPDDATRTLRRVWSYTSTDLYATQIGESLRLPNGNTVQGYGQDGAVREITPDGTVVWQAEWAKDKQGYRVVGHLSLIPDLYAINAGP